MAMQLFALTSVPDRRVVRFALSHEIQESVTNYIASQAKSFVSSYDEEFKFDGKYKPDEREVLYIDNYDDIDKLSEAISRPLSVHEISSDEASLQSVKAIFSGLEKDDGTIDVYLQNFDKRRIISSAGFSLFHSDNVFKQITGVGLTLDTKLAAILNSEKLIFHSFFAVRQIFDLSAYYREATDADIDEFLDAGILYSENKGKIKNISDGWVRRKVALVQQSQTLDNKSVNELKAVALEFGITLISETIGGVERIVLPDNKTDLKEMLRFLDEDYYKSPLSEQNYVANSKRLVT